MTTLERFFSAADRAAIEQAVGAAERGVAGEIVPFAVAASDDYEVAGWKGAALGAVAAAMAAAAAHRLALPWGGVELWIGLPAALGALAGLLAARALPGLRRLLVGQAVIEREVQQRARQAFLDQGVFRTRDRTGILLFVSLFEHRVVVLADEGIHRAVAPGEWEAVVDGVVAAIRAGAPGEGVAAAIRRCGEILERHRVVARADDANELADGLRTSER